MQKIYSAVIEQDDPIFSIAGAYLYSQFNAYDCISLPANVVRQVVGYAKYQLEFLGVLVEKPQSQAELIFKTDNGYDDGSFSVNFKTCQGFETTINGITLESLNGPEAMTC